MIARAGNIPLGRRNLATVTVVRLAPALDAAVAPEGLLGFDPVEQLDAVDQAVEEFDALEDDERVAYLAAHVQVCRPDALRAMARAAV